MTTQQAKQLSESALNRLMAALEQGHSAALKQYLAVMSRFRKYSWICSAQHIQLYVNGRTMFSRSGGIAYWRLYIAPMKLQQLT